MPTRIIHITYRVYGSTWSFQFPRSVDILLFDGRVLHTKLIYRILIQLVQATARYLLSRILYYIIITFIYMCMCVCVCTFYLGTLPKGRWINPQAHILRNPPYIARTSDDRHHLDPLAPPIRKNFSPTNRIRQAWDVPADCERGCSKIVRVHKIRAVRPRSLQLRYCIIYKILYDLYLVFWLPYLIVDIVYVILLLYCYWLIWYLYISTHIIATILMFSSKSHQYEFGRSLFISIRCHSFHIVLFIAYTNNIFFPFFTEFVSFVFVASLLVEKNVLLQ